MARRTFTVVDVVEILAHWYAGRPRPRWPAAWAWTPRRSAKYVARGSGCRHRRPAARRSAKSSGGPRCGSGSRAWPTPGCASRAGQRSTGTGSASRPWSGVVPASVIHQRLVDEEGLEASVASLRRYLRAHFADEVRRGEVVVWRPPVDPGDEAQVDYGYMGTWPTRPAGGAGGCGRSRWCSPTPGTCSSTRC